MKTLEAAQWPYENVGELVPHAGTMLLLDAVLSVTDDTVATQLTVRADGLFDDDSGSVPAWLGMEYMAQSVAAYAGYQGRRTGGSAKIGFLLGTRQFTSSVARLSCGTTVTVTAEKLLQDENGLAAFQCSLTGTDIHTGDAIQQTATLSVFQPDDPQALLAAS